MIGSRFPVGPAVARARTLAGALPGSVVALLGSTWIWGHRVLVYPRSILLRPELNGCIQYFISCFRLEIGGRAVHVQFSFLTSVSIRVNPWFKTSFQPVFSASKCTSHQKTPMPSGFLPFSL